MDLSTTIEAMENRFMRAWVAGDLRALKSLTARNFRMVVGSQPAVLLDTKSWLAAAADRYLCDSYSFSERYVRDLKGVAIFASRLDLQASMDGEDWSGQFWITDLWRKSRIRRNWQLIERHMSAPILDEQVRPGIRALQLWR